MAVRFSIRNGQATPSVSDLELLELGADVTDANNPRIYTKTSSGIHPIGVGDALSLGEVLPENYARTDINETFEQNVTVNGTLDATAERAKYADIAEYYECDKEYEAGDILMVGEETEAILADGSKMIMGVCSTAPAYLMNTKIQEDEEVEHYAPLALKGRIPVKITGSAKRGDYIILDVKNPGKGRAVKTYPKTEAEKLFIGVCVTPGKKTCEVRV